MALKSKTEKQEEENTEAVDTEATAEKKETTAKPKVDKKKPATKEVAVKEDTAVAVFDPSEASVFIRNPDFIEAVEGAKYGDFPSIVASNGSHEGAGESTADLGKVIKFQAIKANPIFKVIPGVDDDESKDFFQVSTDGETVADGRSLEDALADAIEAGYELASIKEYVDVIALIVECDNDEDFIGETVNLQLAPSSKWNWSKLEKKVKMKAAMRKLEAAPIAGNPELGTAVVFTSTATSAKVKGSSKTYTKFEYTLD